MPYPLSVKRVIVSFHISTILDVLAACLFGVLLVLALYGSLKNNSVLSDNDIQTMLVGTGVFGGLALLHLLIAGFKQVLIYYLKQGQPWAHTAAIITSIILLVSFVLVSPQCIIGIIMILGLIHPATDQFFYNKPRD